MANTLTPPHSFSAISIPTAPNHNSVTLSQPQQAFPSRLTRRRTPSLPLQSLPTAETMVYTPRFTPGQHNQAHMIAATLPDIAARVLLDANCTLPLVVTTKVNDRGSITLLITDTTSPTGAFVAYFDGLMSPLNRPFTVGNAPWLPFWLAPTKSSSQSTLCQSPSSLLTLNSSSPASPTPSITPKTSASPRQDSSTQHRFPLW